MTGTPVSQDSSLTPRPGAMRAFFRKALRRPDIALSLLVIAILVFTAIFADVIAPYDPNAQDLLDNLMPMSSQYWLGTDGLGRDVLSRLIHGARVSLQVGVFSVTIAAIIGTLIGMLSGYYRGIADTILMRIMDALISVPPIILAIAMAAVLGSGVANVVLALAVALVPTYARVMRSLVLVIRELDYTVSARVAGAGELRILSQHIFPNCLPSLVVLITLNMGQAILAEASLSFLGIGITPPQAAWGAMVSDGYRYLVQYPWLSILPGICVVVTVLAFNLAGDGLRDMLDPRLKGQL